MDCYMSLTALYKYSYGSLFVQVLEQINAAQLAIFTEYEPTVFISKAELG